MSEIRPRIQFFAAVDLEDVVEPLNGLVLSLPDRHAAVINDIVVRRGELLHRSPRKRSDRERSVRGKPSHRARPVDPPAC